jgi:hypothetical protein
MGYDDNDGLQTRRVGDDPRDLSARLSQVESHVAALEGKVNILSLEQRHMLELFRSQFQSIEKSVEVGITEIRAINAQIGLMASEADKSPAGRALLGRLLEYEKSCRDQEHEIADLKRRADQYDGGLGLVKWLGVGGLVSGLSALLWVWLRVQGVSP